jgi:hypothetical protein
VRVLSLMQCVSYLCYLCYALRVLSLLCVSYFCYAVRVLSLQMQCLSYLYPCPISTSYLYQSSVVDRLNCPELEMAAMAAT